MIELGKESEQELNYDDAYMYCFWQEPVGYWRLPTQDEFTAKKELARCWYEDRDQMMEKVYQQTPKLKVIPVRTVND